jgi:hypothetical protein
MRIFIRGQDYGIRNFEISHKPSGEAGQANYTTILRWGRDFTPTVLKENDPKAMSSNHRKFVGNPAFLFVARSILSKMIPETCSLLPNIGCAQGSKP